MYSWLLIFRFWKAILAAEAVGTTAAGVAAVPFLAGFTSTGVVAGSTAAAIQSTIGSVAAGSWFATMQSLAATTIIGTAAPLVLAGVGAAALVGTGAYVINKEIKRDKSRQEKKKNVRVVYKKKEN